MLASIIGPAFPGRIVTLFGRPVAIFVEEACGGDFVIAPVVAFGIADAIPVDAVHVILRDHVQGHPADVVLHARDARIQAVVRLGEHLAGAILHRPLRMPAPGMPWGRRRPLLAPDAVGLQPGVHLHAGCMRLGDQVGQRVERWPAGDVRRAGLVCRVVVRVAALAHLRDDYVIVRGLESVHQLRHLRRAENALVPGIHPGCPYFGRQRLAAGPCGDMQGGDRRWIARRHTWPAGGGVSCRAGWRRGGAAAGQRARRLVGWGHCQHLGAPSGGGCWPQAAIATSNTCGRPIKTSTVCARSQCRCATMGVFLPAFTEPGSRSSKCLS